MSEETEKPSKDKFVYYLVLVAVGIISIIFAVGFMFVEPSSMENMAEVAGHYRTAPFSQGSILIISFVL